MRRHNTQFLLIPSGSYVLHTWSVGVNGLITWAHLNQSLPPTLVPQTFHSYSEFTDVYGDAIGQQLPFLPPGTVPPTNWNIPSSKQDAQIEPVRLAWAAILGFFLNGGHKCHVVRCKSESDVPAALAALSPFDDIAFICAPGTFTPGTHRALIGNCESSPGRFAIIDPMDAMWPSNHPESLISADIVSQHASAYYPWLSVQDRVSELQGKGAGVFVPPSAHVAGAILRTDRERGIWRAPGNIALIGTNGLRHTVSAADMDILAQANVNTIRLINGSPTIWGTHTLTTKSNNEFKYISVSRFVSQLDRAIEAGTRWAVFEANSPSLWALLRSSVENYLWQQWRAGGLLGSKPTDAYSVKCDASTNSGDDRLILIYGVAVLRPAEFIVRRVEIVISG